MAAQIEKNDEYGSLDKFNILFNAYEKALRRKAYSILKDNGWAEDAVQWTFQKMLNHLDDIDTPFSSETRSYLYTILINSCYSILKANKKYHLVDDWMMQTDYGMKMVERDRSSDHIICEELLNDIKDLPDIYSNILMMYGFYNYSLQEISEMLHLKPATVRKRMQRGREMLIKKRREDGY